MEFRDLHAQYEIYKNDIDSAIERVIKNTQFIEGKEVQELEQQLSEYVGVKHCITCANGTDALTLVLKAWGVQAGDAVFVPDFTFFATGEVVSFCGATPIFVDVCWDTFNMDPVKLEQAIIKTIQEGKLKPKVIITVDLFGLPADYGKIEPIAKEYNLLVLEDAAQGFGGQFNGQKACSFGHAATTSFFPAKPLGCYGDGGAIFTNDDGLAELLKSLKIHGKGRDKYDNVRVGVNSRLDTLQAAVLKVKLKAFTDHELQDVNEIYKLYNERLAGTLEIPIIPDNYYSSFAQYTIKLKNQYERDQLKNYLKQKNIPSMIYYTKPLHRQAAFAHLQFNDYDFVQSIQLSERVLSLPMHPYMKKVDVDFVSEAILRFIQ